MSGVNRAVDCDSNGRDTKEEIDVGPCALELAVLVIRVIVAVDM